MVGAITGGGHLKKLNLKTKNTPYKRVFLYP